MEQPESALRTQYGGKTYKLALSVATRPDCLPPEVPDLQTIHPAFAAHIRRSYDLCARQKA